MISSEPAAIDAPTRPPAPKMLAPSKILAIHRRGFDITNSDRKTTTVRSLIDRPYFVIAAVILAFLVKLSIAYCTIGTNDVVSFHQFGQHLWRNGLESTYRHSIFFNHPPLTAWYLHALTQMETTGLLARKGVHFPFMLRLPGIVSDLLVVLILLRLNSQQRYIPEWLLAVFALSPVSIMVSGFHGNTDGVMVLFLVAAAWMAVQQRPFLCGLFLALSCQVKIIALLVLPILWLFWISRRGAIRFSVAFATLCLLIWAHPLFSYPAVFLRNVFAYDSFWGEWGLTYWLRLTDWGQLGGTGSFNVPLSVAAIAFLLKTVIIAAVCLIAWRHRDVVSARVLYSIALAWIVFFALAPGIAPQYLVWPAPFLLLFSPRYYAWVTAASSLFLFFFYNQITHGLWYFGVSTNDQARVDRWAPWALWPWAAFLVGIALFWQQALKLGTTSAVQLKPAPGELP